MHQYYTISQSATATISKSKIKHWLNFLPITHPGLSENPAPNGSQEVYDHLHNKVPEIRRSRQTCPANFEKCPVKGFDLAGHFVWQMSCEELVVCWTKCPAKLKRISRTLPTNPNARLFEKMMPDFHYFGRFGAILGGWGGHILRILESL